MLPDSYSARSTGRYPLLVADFGGWETLIASRTDSGPSLSVVATVSPSGGTWSGPFRVIGSDGNDWFVKSLQTCPPGQEASIAIEHIVARVGGLIGAPMCDTSLIRIPPEIAGWEPRPGVALTEGWAHGSRALEHADERGRPSLDARRQDDNARRHVGIYALFDWCFGCDQQWLYDIDSDRTIYSHDHGLYLPPLGTGYWTAADLVTVVDKPNPLPDPPQGLNNAEIEAVAQALEAINRDALASILNGVPTSWPVTDVDLGALGWFLESRAKPVAARLRALA